ncbi:MAG: YfhO family protein [Thermoflexales bacterium]|nr:YfhO family protein [Thermoflexales bacterium]
MLLFLSAAVALFFWPLWIAGYRFPKGSGDLWGQLYPVWSFVAEWVRRGVFPLWDTRMMGGDPIVAEGQYGLLNPLNWPLFLVYPIPQWLVLLRGAFSLWLAGAGLYLYLRRSPVWRLGQAPALLGAVAYMFSDPFVVHLGHPQFNDAMAWLPWAFLGVDRATRSGRQIPKAALPVAMLLLAGHGQASLYGSLALGLYALWQAAEGSWPQGLQRLGRLAVAGAIGIALAMPALFPGLERLPFTERTGVPPELRRGYEFLSAMVVDFLTPLFHGRGADQFWLTPERVESGYIGAVALFLVVPGILGTPRSRRTWAVIGLGVLAYVFSLGYRGPLYPMVAHLPLFAESWKTGRAIFLVSFALAVLAALGMEQLSRGPRWLLVCWVIGLVLVGALIWVQAPQWASVAPNTPSRARALTGLRFAALLAVTTAFLGWAAARGRLWGRAGIVLLLLVELVALGATAETERAPSADEDPHHAARAFLRADSGWFRVDVDPIARGLWSPASLCAEGFEVAQGTGNPMELREFNILRWRIPSVTHPAYQMLGVKYLIVPKGAPTGGEGIWPVFVDDPTVDIHLNTRALPRAWLVYRTEVVENYGQALERVLEENFRPEEVAVIQNGPQLNGRGQGRIEVGYYGPNDAVFIVETNAPALLVLSDTFYPGWQARVDGQPVPIHRTNAVFRGVLVPAGTHRVEMRYRPQSLRWGIGLMGWGVFALAGIFTGRVRRWRR